MNPFSKDELTRLITRLIGVFFLWMALTKISGFGFLIYQCFQEWSLPLSDLLAWEIMWPNAVLFLAYSGGSTYFLRYGKAFQRLISRPNDDFPSELQDCISKDQLAWLITRLMGILFSWEALTAIFRLLHLSYVRHFYQNGMIGRGITRAIQYDTSKMELALSAVLALVALYLLYGGRKIQQLISR